MPYELYKVIHIGFVFLFLMGSSIVFWTENTPKIFKILSGVATLLIFVAGMGLMARLGISHGSAWPLWIKLKMGIWLLLGVGAPVLARRFPKFNRLSFWGMYVLAVLAAVFAIYKP